MCIQTPLESQLIFRLLIVVLPLSVIFGTTETGVTRASSFTNSIYCDSGLYALLRQDQGRILQGQTTHQSQEVGPESAQEINTSRPMRVRAAAAMMLAIIFLSSGFTIAPSSPMAMAMVLAHNVGRLFVLKTLSAGWHRHQVQTLRWKLYATARKIVFRGRSVGMLQCVLQSHCFTPK